MEKLRKSIGVDRKLTMREILLYVFGHIENIPNRRECIEQEFDNLDKELKIGDDIYNYAKEFFEAYSSDKTFRKIIDSKRFADLSVHPSGEAFKKLPKEFKENIPLYIQKNVKLERLENFG